MSGEKNSNTAPVRDLTVKQGFKLSKFLVSWEMVLVYILILINIMGAGFVFLLQKSKFGRKLYIIGNNPTCAEYSGIDVKKTKLLVFVIMGAMCGVASIFFVGRMGGSVSSTMGTGYEMTAIAICVLGGVSTNGGKGKVYGPIIATLIMAFLTYTLGLLEVDANTRKIVTGFILIIAVLIPNVNKQLLANLKLKFIYKGNKNAEALNNRTLEEVKALKNTIAETRKDTSLSEPDKGVKIKKCEDKIASLQKKCKEQTAALLKEQREDERKAKERFAVK